MRVQSFDSSDVGPNGHVERWGETIAGVKGLLQTEIIGPAPFFGRIRRADIGAMRLLHIEAGPHRITSGLGHPPDRQIVRIVIQIRGTAAFSQGGHQLLLEPGCWTTWPVSRPHTVTNTTDVEQLCLLIPRKMLGVAEGELLRHRGSQLGAGPGIGRIVPEYLGNLFEQMDAINETVHSEMTDIVAHLIRLALGEAVAVVPREPMRETMRGRVLDHIRHNLGDPGLTLDQIAGRFGWTKRHLHKIFSNDDTTLSQFIWRERLARCHEALASADFADRSITELAFMWGFNNSSHFSKLFKARYGVAPGLWRAAAMADRPRVSSASV